MKPWRFVTINQLRLWQAATFMLSAALILSLCACTGNRARADARAWSAYSQGVGKIIQQEVK